MFEGPGTAEVKLGRYKPRRMSGFIVFHKVRYPQKSIGGSVVFCIYEKTTCFDIIFHIVRRRERGDDMYNEEWPAFLR